MLHEIQPGDVVIVTVPTMPVADDPIKEMLDGKANGLTVYCPNATETSVHVIRAKKGEEPARKRCPCEFGEPCHHNCSCPQRGMSGGCRRCCTYGSAEQQAASAKRIIAAEGGWPAWRDGKVEKPPIGSNVLYWSVGNRMAHVHYNVQALDVFATHWMPLPEGPK